MPTECERSATSLEDPAPQTQQPSSEADKTKTPQQHETTLDSSAKMDTNGEMSTSQTSNSSATSNGQNGGGCNGAGKKLTPISPDPTSYVTKARVTRPTPPPPSKNPMQFVAIKPCNLYQTAQEQLKKAEEVKKIKEIKKEEPEDWQCNLDNWKSSRRKRVEHIIDRVVEVKKLELEEHDRTRRKSKTFSEMIEERGERGRPRTKLASLAVYQEDESNDLSDLGIGTSSASGKSSQSEDYDNNSVMSDNAELDKPSVYESKPNTSNHHPNAACTTNGSTREYISSPGYDTSSSTAPASSPDPCEYTYEGAIQDYKQRVSRASVSGSSATAAPSAPAHNGGSPYKMSKESTPDRPAAPHNDGYPTRRGSKIEDRLIGFEVSSPSDNQEGAEKNKVAVDVPKIDISKRKEIFESQASGAGDVKPKPKPSSSSAVPKVTLRERFQFASGEDKEKEVASKKETKRLSGDITSIRERLQSLEQQQNIVNASKSHAASAMSSSAVDMPPVAPLKERLSSLQASVTKEVERKPPVSLIDARQLEIMNAEEEQAKQRMRQMAAGQPSVVIEKPAVVVEKPTVVIEKPSKTQQDLKDLKDDSGIHMESGDEPKPSMAQQEEQLNAAIAALALEERQLEAAANAVNQIEAEFAELSATSSVMMPPLAQEATTAPSDPMEFSINEALELALEAIDKETSKINAATPTTIRKTQMTTSTTTKTKSMTTTIATTAMTTIQTTIENEDTADGGLREAITNNSNSSNNGDDQQLIQKQQQQQQLRLADDEHNCTDEEKELKTKLQQQQQLATLAGHRTDDDDPLVTPSPPPNDDDDELQIEADDEADEEEAEDDRHELKIAREPIYENIAATQTTTSMYELDVTAITKIIPMTNSNVSNSNNNMNAVNKQNNNMNAVNKQNSNGSYKNDNQNNNNNQMNNNINNNNIQNIIHNNQMNNNINNNTMSNTQNKNNNMSNTQNKNNLNNNNTGIFDASKDDEPSPHHRPLVELPPKERPLTSGEPVATPADPEPYYQVPKSSEPYYDAPRHLRPVPLYENIEVFYTGLEGGSGLGTGPLPEPPKEKPPPPPVDSPPLFDEDDADDNVDGPMHNNNGNNNMNTWSSDNTYETISSRHSQGQGGRGQSPPPPIKRMNSTKRIKKELRSKRSSFLGIEGTAPDDEDSYLEYIVAPPPDMAQLLQEERRLEKQLYMKAGLCDSSDTGESRDSGVSENHSRQSSEPYTNSSEELDRHSLKCSPMAGSPDAYHHTAIDTLQVAAHQTPLLQTVKGNSAESWTESATAAAAASQSLTEATATANAKMMSIEEKIREQEEVLRVERELLQLEQEELKRQRENLMLRENMARRELQHGAKMLMSANRRSLQDLNGVMTPSLQGRPQPLTQQQIYANVPPTPPTPQQHAHYYQVQADYRKSLSDLNEFSKRLMLAPPTPPTKPMRSATGGTGEDYRRQPLMGGGGAAFGNGGGPFVGGEAPFAAGGSSFTAGGSSFGNGGGPFAAGGSSFAPGVVGGGSLVKIATQPMATPRGPIYSNYQQQPQPQPQPPQHHQSVQNLSSSGGALQPGNMSRNTLHALSATPKPKYTDGWVQVQSRKSYEAAGGGNLANDPAWMSAYQQKRKSMPDAALLYQQQQQQGGYQNNNSNNHWLVQEAEQRRLVEQQRKSGSAGSTPTHRPAAASNGKPLPDSIIQTLTERVQSKGIGERKRFDKTSTLHSNNYHHHQSHQPHQHQHQHPISPKASQQLPTAAHRHFVGNGLETVADSNGQQAANNTAGPPASSPDKVLSVSGKKKCSHCGDELGRGAAMIIESLLLFYHINCFKCCVCHVQLGDGLNGTDVRVRNHKLHCQNCYSSDDGIKFSCV